MASIKIRDAADADALHVEWTVGELLRPEFDCKCKAFHRGPTLH